MDVKTAARVLDVLNLFAEAQKPLLYSEIAAQMEIPLSSCHGLLKTMVARGYLYEIGKKHGYYPTQKLIHVATLICRSDPLNAVIEPVLARVRRAAGDHLDPGGLAAAPVIQRRDPPGPGGGVARLDAVVAVRGFQPDAAHLRPHLAAAVGAHAAASAASTAGQANPARRIEWARGIARMDLFYHASRDIELPRSSRRSAAERTVRACEACGHELEPGERLDGFGGWRHGATASIRASSCSSA